VEIVATLEERLQNLERVLSIMQTEHISDIKQLGERVNELQQQITEQRRRMSEQEQSIHQRFDSLEKALSQQFATIDQKFSQLIQGFAQLNQSFLRLEQQGRQQTDEIKAKFDMSDHFAARTWGVVQEQERDMRTTKENVQTILGRFDGQEQILKQILERLPKQGE
jgi:chromosome segregation ATPase